MNHDDMNAADCGKLFIGRTKLGRITLGRITTARLLAGAMTLTLTMGASLSVSPLANAQSDVMEVNATETPAMEASEAAEVEADETMASEAATEETEALEAEEVVEPEAEPLPSREATPLDGPRYPVSAFELEYIPPTDELPIPENVVSLDKVLMGATVELLATPEGYVAPRDGLLSTTLNLSQIASQSEDDPYYFYGSALITIADALAQALNEQGLAAVRTGVSPDDIDQSLNDLRGPERTELKLLIAAAPIDGIRTLANGPRIPKEERIDNPVHDRIIRNSPLSSGDAVRMDELDSFLFRLNRHPARRVDAALAAGEADGTVALDYIVSENKQWTAYIQAENTGTEATEDWRFRFGYTNYQFTGNDDTLDIQYLTSSDFEKVHTVVASYDSPLGDSEHLRYRLAGNWGEYDASVDAATSFGTGVNLAGHSWSVGGDLIANILQVDELFLDAIAGFRAEEYRVERDTGAGQVNQTELFFYARAGLGLQAKKPTSTTSGELMFLMSIPEVFDTTEDPAELDDAFRLAIDSDFVVGQLRLAHSFYLEPLLFGDEWLDIESSKAKLAHEFRIETLFQYAFDDRPIPQKQLAIGGMRSIRGYTESESVGDNGFYARFEYRYHVPRGFDIEPQPGRLFGEEFRFAPAQPYGPADWDLVLGGFFDIGHIDQNSVNTTTGSTSTIEQSNTLIGAGPFVEFRFKQNFMARVDYGIALRETVDDSGGSVRTDDGDSEVHASITLLF